MSRTTHVKLSVEPLLKYSVGPSRIFALLTARKWNERGKISVQWCGRKGWCCETCIKSVCVWLILHTYRLHWVGWKDSFWAWWPPANIYKKWSVCSLVRESNKQAEPGGCHNSPYLAFVDARVFLSRIADLQWPIVAIVQMYSLETLIRGVCETAH